MRRIKNSSFKFRFGLILGCIITQSIVTRLSGFGDTFSSATVKFSSRSSKIMIGDPLSSLTGTLTLNATSNANMSGLPRFQCWGQDSVIQSEANAGGLGDTSAIPETGTTTGVIELVRATSEVVNAVGLNNTLIRTTSNAFVSYKNGGGGGGSLATATSNWIATFMHTNSNALVYTNQTVRTNSNALVYANQLARASSNAIAVTSSLARTTSNAFVSYKNGGGGGSLATATSNWILTFMHTNSNALVYTNQTVRTNSNALVYANQLVRTSSNAIAVTSLLGRTTSNAFRASSYISATSNWIANFMRTSSNASAQQAASISSLGTRVGNNEGAVSSLNTQLKQAGIETGSTTVSVDTSLAVNHYLNGNNTITFDVATRAPGRSVDTIIYDGNGFFIQFANGVKSTMTVAAGTQLILTNVLLQDYFDGAIYVAPGGSLVFGDGVVVEFAHNDALSSSMTTQGNVRINGQGNIVNLNNNRLTVQSGVLTLQNITLTEVGADSISCKSDAATVELSNAGLELSSGFNFTAGSLLVSGLVAIDGQQTFGYASDQPLYISKNSTLELALGSTFVYEPSSNDRDLITMVDETSTLALGGCSLISTTTGMRLTSGRLVVDGNNSLYNLGATSLSQAICFGNGDAAGDLLIELMPGASMQLASGILDYNNVNG